MTEKGAAYWRKSSRSGNNGCVEVAAGWRKSSRSGDNGCVEVAGDLAGLVGVRDSKDPAGPALRFGPAGWRAFVSAVRSGDVDRCPARRPVPGR